MPPIGVRLFCVILLLALSGALPCAATDEPAKISVPESAQAPMTMEQWAKVRQEADEAMNAPKGSERIARCEAFVRDHPGYTDLDRVLATLVEAYVETAQLDPARVAGLLEQLSGLQALEYERQPEGLVDRYYFKYHLPLDSAERLLHKAREQVAHEEAALARMPAGKRKDERRLSLDLRKPRIELSEGRILLARGKYPAALEHLLRAQSLGTASGWLGPLIRSAGNGPVRGFSAPHPSSDKLNLALATAYLRTGDRKRARQKLDLVQAFVPEFVREVALEREQLVKELEVRYPEPWEVRSEPRLAQDFRLKDLDGKEVALADFKDRVVLAMFWATW